MLLTLRDFAQLPQHCTVDSCVVVLLTHGLEGQIYGSDAKLINLTEVFGFFDGNVCPNLQGKPKFFLVQACRGGMFLYLYVCLAFACQTSYFLHRYLFQHETLKLHFCNSNQVSFALILCPSEYVVLTLKQPSLPL